MLGSDDNDRAVNRAIRMVHRIVVMSFDDNIYVLDIRCFNVKYAN